MKGEASRTYDVPPHVVAATLISRIQAMGCDLLGVGDFGNSVTFQCALPEWAGAPTMTARLVSDGHVGSVMTLRASGSGELPAQQLSQLQDLVFTEVLERLRARGMTSS